MFDFVQPRFAGWRVRGFGGQAGGEEAGRYAIHMLLIAYKRAFNPPFTRHSDSRRRPGPADVSVEPSLHAKRGAGSGRQSPLISRSR
jgi:hypothetical protein